MNELNHLDALFNHLLIESSLPGFGITNPIYAPQGLTYHAERFLSDPRIKEVIKKNGVVSATFITIVPKPNNMWKKDINMIFGNSAILSGIDNTVARCSAAQVNEISLAFKVDSLY